ncbi:hypothetical protein L248_1964 [Schleiferilactobacillus shenzhenensis LY-73]|uniref:Uncharacterized protein n=1 Tax=Schleiferilactobacillus shenzhenensis LY-73 TaxID=1231336 RepID=U4TVM2_9LACO|nr:hypothetical protein L248_1964 [Schleiferilactobacillus shenzhenensis LY-73]
MGEQRLLQNTGDDAQLGVGDPANRRIAGRDRCYFALFRTGLVSNFRRCGFTTMSPFASSLPKLSQ